MSDDRGRLEEDRNEGNGPLYEPGERSYAEKRGSERTMDPPRISSLSAIDRLSPAHPATHTHTHTHTHKSARCPAPPLGRNFRWSRTELDLARHVRGRVQDALDDDDPSEPAVHQVEGIKGDA